MEEYLIDKKTLQDLNNLALNVCETVKRLQKAKSEREKTKQPLENKDWEIVSYCGLKSGNIPVKLAKEIHIDVSKHEIYSVKRLSDNTDWCVNEITDGNNRIHAFELTGNILSVHLQTVSTPVQGWLTNIESLTKKQRTPLFTTHDGKAVHEGEDYWWIYSNTDEIFSNIAKAEHGCGRSQNCIYFSSKHEAKEYIEKNKKPLFTTEDNVPIYEGEDAVIVTDEWKALYKGHFNKEKYEVYKNCKFFSDKEKANEYILMNKPCLSMKEIKSVSICNDDNPVELWKTNHHFLTALAEQKIKNNGH